MCEEKKVNVPQEITEDELDMVAGGAYSREEWSKMSDEEREAAMMRSVMAKHVLNVTCELD